MGTYRGSTGHARARTHARTRARARADADADAGAGAGAGASASAGAHSRYHCHPLLVGGRVALGTGAVDADVGDVGVPVVPCAIK